MSFATRLAELRAKKHMSQADLAKAFGLSRGAVGMYESGQRFPGDETMLKKMADYFGVSVDYLLDHTNDPAFEDQTPEDIQVIWRALPDLTVADRQQVLLFIKWLHAKIDMEKGPRSQ